MNVIRSQTRGKNIELDELRIEMIRRGLTYRQLAEIIGRDKQQVANVLTGNNPSWPIRAAINRALRKRIFCKSARGGKQATAKRKYEE
jgi:hypothetical protein